MLKAQSSVEIVGHPEQNDIKNMAIKLTKAYLGRIEEVFAETGYILRYEKGNFKSGYCLLKDTRIAVINQYFSLEGKINSLVEILREIPIDPRNISEKNRKIYFELMQTNLPEVPEN
jgi:hypothetical protein